MRVTGGLAAEPEGAGPERGAGDGHPGARGMVVGGGAVQGDASAGADLVAEDQRGQELGAVAAAFGLGERQRDGEGAAADVALGELMTVVGVERVDGHAPG